MLTEFASDLHATNSENRFKSTIFFQNGKNSFLQRKKNDFFWITNSLLAGQVLGCAKGVHNLLNDANLMGLCTELGKKLHLLCQPQGN